MASSSVLKGKELVTDDMADDALIPSRYHVKRCFAKYLEKGRRIIKLHDLMEEMEHVIDNNNERNQVLEGNLGFLLSCTQVFFFSLLFYSPCCVCYSVTLSLTFEF